MKYVIICLVAFIMPFTIRAQQVFGGTSQQVKDELTKNGLIYQKTDKRPDGTIYDLYSYRNGGENGGEDISCYFNKALICYQYRRICPQATLIDNLEYLNKNYIKVDDTSWVNKKNTVKVYLTFGADRVLYYLSYISMEISDN